MLNHRGTERTERRHSNHFPSLKDTEGTEGTESILRDAGDTVSMNRRDKKRFVSIQPQRHRGHRGRTQRFFLFF